MYYILKLARYIEILFYLHLFYVSAAMRAYRICEGSFIKCLLRISFRLRL